MNPITVPGTLGSLNLLRDHVVSAAQAAQLDERSAFRLALAVDEIATNAIVHGYSEAGQNGSLTLWWELTPDLLTLFLEDTGVAYDPQQVALPTNLNQPLEQRDVGGLGIYFSRRSVDEFRYERIADRNRNIFVMNRVQQSQNLTDLVEPTILVVGSPPASETLLDYLKQSGYITLSASAASDVLQIVSLQRVDLILMSMKVDEMAALLRLLKAAPTLWSIPVVACAQSGDQTTPLVEAGADDIVIGAFVPEFFDMRLRIALAHKKRADEHAAYVRQLEELSNDLRTVILPLGIALTMEKDLNRLLEKIVLEAKGLCNADGGTLYLNTPDNTLRFTIMHTTSLKIAMGGTTGIPIPIPPLRMYDATGAPNYANVTTSVALTHQSVNIPDIYNAQDYDFSATREFDERNGYRSISSLAVPLMNNDGEIVGVLQLLNAIDPETGQVIPFDSYHQLLVEMLATQAAVAVNNQIMVERQKELLKLERDVQIGRQIQQGFLPESLPQPENWEIAAYFDPAREVSGDFYDAFPIGNDRIGIVIADVCDKGVGAALFMSLVRSLVRAYGQQRHTVDWVELIGTDLSSPPDVSGSEAPNEPRVLHSSKTVAVKKTIELTNKYILDNHSSLNMFATMFLGALDPQTGTLFYVNCGHNPPVIAGPKGIRARLASEFPAVGMMPDLQVHVRETTLEPGEMLITFTDGVIEAQSPTGGMFTDARLMALIERPESNEASAKATLDRVREQLQAHIGGAAQFDDITMLAVWRRPQI